MGFPIAILKDGKFAKFTLDTKPPYFDTSLQKTLIDNPKTRQDDLKKNLGFRVPDNAARHLVHLVQHHRTPEAWKAFYRVETNRYNKVDMTLNDRMKTLFEEPVGTALMVGETHDGKHFITFVNAPTITELDMHDKATMGASDLREMIDDDALDKWHIPEEGNTHWILASMGWNTCQQPLDALPTFIAGGKPVIITNALFLSLDHSSQFMIQLVCPHPELPRNPNWSPI